ncbi:O-antigen ligase family protein [bacterium]|nr:O-antigen ligase family protein [bacterium]
MLASRYYYDLLNGLLMLTVFISTFNHKLTKKLLVITLIIAATRYIDIKMLKKLLQEPIVRVMLLTFSYMALSLLWTPDFHEGKGIVENYIFYFMLPILVFALIPDQKYIYLLVKTFVFAMVINELISYGILFEIWGELNDQGYPTPFLHHTLYSVLVIFAIFIIGYELIHTKSIISRLFYLLFLLTMSGNLIISGGRNGQVTLFVIVLILTLNYVQTSYKKALLMLFAPILIITVAYFSYDQFQERLKLIYTDSMAVIEQQNFRTSFGNRLFSYFLAEEYVKDYNYLIGEGAGSIKIIKNTIIDKHFSGAHQSARQYSHFHQYYISTLVQYGLIGLVLLFLMFYYLYKIKIKDPQLHYIKNITLLVIIISDTADGMLFIRAVMVIFAIFIGLALAQQRVEQDILKRSS